jgi:hypothetical protein
MRISNVKRNQLDGARNIQKTEYCTRDVPAMLTTSKTLIISNTTTTGVLTMLSYATMTGRDVTAVLAGFAKTGGHAI